MDREGKRVGWVPGSTSLGSCTLRGRPCPCPCPRPHGTAQGPKLRHHGGREGLQGAREGGGGPGAKGEGQAGGAGGGGGATHHPHGAGAPQQGTLFLPSAGLGLLGLGLLVHGLRQVTGQPRPQNDLEDGFEAWWGVRVMGRGGGPS